MQLIRRIAGSLLARYQGWRAGGQHPPAGGGAAAPAGKPAALPPSCGDTESAIGIGKRKHRPRAPADAGCTGRCEGCRGECPFRAAVEAAPATSSPRLTLDASRGACRNERAPSRCCGACVYASRVRGGGPAELICVNHPDAPGELTRVQPGGRCRHFRARRGSRRRHGEPESTDDDIRYLALTRGRFAIVAAADYPALSKYHWFTSGNRRRKCYAARTQRGKTIYLHRQIMQTRPGLVADHINGNTYDNCRHNLRNCTQQQNTWNARGQGASSGFKGVWYNKKRKLFRAAIVIDHTRIYLGWFADPVEAARVRDCKARELYGPYAYLNFPADDPASVRDTRNEMRATAGRPRKTRTTRTRRPWTHSEPWAPAALFHAAPGRTVLCPRPSVLGLSGVPPPRARHRSLTSS